MATPETSSTASPRGPGKNPSTSELLARQEDYMALRRNVALGMLFVAPALIALPPRKLDFFTFGLGFAWVYCLNEVTKSHGTDLLHLIGGKPQPTAAVEQAEAERGITHGWKGDSVYAQHREREEDGKGIGEMILESVWDVWQQRDKRHLTPEQEAEEDLPLKERVEKYAMEAREKKEREAVDALTKK